MNYSEPKELPDGPGWWAFEDERDKFVTEITIWHRAEDTIEFEFDISGKDMVDADTFRSMYPGKWWKLTMPWDAQANE